LLKQSDPLDIMVLAAGVLQECPLLKKMPSLKKTGDEQADQEQSLQRAALIEVIDNLWFHPEDALACSSWLKSRIQARERTPVDDDIFKVVPVTLGAVPDDYIVSYLKTRFGLEDSLLGLMKAWDPDSLKHLFYARLQLLPGLRLGDSCRNKHVLSYALDARCEGIPPLPMLAKGTNIDGTTGEVDYGKVGMYAMEFIDKKGSRILHRPTGDYAAIDDDLCVTLEWAIKDNWSNLKATLVKGSTRKYRLQPFFEKGMGPNRVATLTGQSEPWKTLVGAAVTMHEGRKRAASAGALQEVEVEQFNMAKRQRASDAASKARESLQKKHKEREQKRLVSLQGSIVVTPPAAAPDVN
jgi:hypothetical protein